MPTESEHARRLPTIPSRLWSHDARQTCSYCKISLVYKVTIYYKCLLVLQNTRNPRYHCTPFIFRVKDRPTGTWLTLQRWMWRQYDPSKHLRNCHHIPGDSTFCNVGTSNLTINFLTFRSDYEGSTDKVRTSSHRGHGRIYRQWFLWHRHDHWYRFCAPSYHRGDRRNCLYRILPSTHVHYGGHGQALWVSSSVEGNWKRWIVILIIGVCILSCVYQLNIRTPPYATNVSACFIVHSLHYMFRPWSVAIFRWFATQNIFKGSY
jgi:hypothetical protein